MGLDTADWQEVQSVLSETFKIWTPGLNKTQYYYYTWRQLGHPWARKNYRFFVYRPAKEIVGSLKLYAIDMNVRGRIYRFAGLGAVYTMEAFRGKGFGKSLMEEVIALAQAEGFDGAYLFSDIDARFYERFGFKQMGGREFWLYLPDSTTSPAVLEVAGGPERRERLLQDVIPVTMEQISLMGRHHRRWLRRQPYGVDRSSSFWNYKLWRELFLHNNSSWTWPTLELVLDEPYGPAGGYAMIEQGGKVLRVMEVVGDAETRRKLWGKLVALALFRGLTRIRGWESQTPAEIGRINLTPRSWGLPMVLPFRKELFGLTEEKPCMLLELDHL